MSKSVTHGAYSANVFNFSIFTELITFLHNFPVPMAVFIHAQYITITVTQVQIKYTCKRMHILIFLTPIISIHNHRV